MQYGFAYTTVLKNEMATERKAINSTRRCSALIASCGPQNATEVASDQSSLERWP